MISLKDKKSTPYKVKTLSKAVKDVDTDKRIVTGLFNSYFYIDSDGDMLVSGAASKSIKERGPGTTSGNKIKHLKDHDWGKNIARIDVIEERKVDFEGKELEGIYHESYYSKSTDGNDQLIKIQEGLYDDRSIGFMYITLGIAEKESENEDERKRWNDFYPLALNPELADKHGYFYVVKEIHLFEGSDVAFGANSLTPLFDIKSEGYNDNIKIELFKKLDIMNSLFKTGTLTDEGFQRLEMEQRQIKSIINAFGDAQPSIKDTLIDQGRKNIDTEKNTGKDFLQNLMK